MALAAAQDDDRVRPVGQRILAGPDVQVRRRAGEQREDDDREGPGQWAIARSTASSSSGESATEGRPRSSSFM
jgi:hypothetical protein